MINRLEWAKMAPALQEVLRARVERLGYVGEFFKCAAHQPDALASFMRFTEDLRQALPPNLTELTALTVASWMGNDYERHQHEQLCLKLGFTSGWVRAVIAGQGDPSLLSEQERLTRRLVLAMLERRGHQVGPELEDLVRVVGEGDAVGVLLLVGRYVAHALFVNALGLAPPVASIFQGATA